MPGWVKVSYVSKEIRGHVLIIRLLRRPVVPFAAAATHQIFRRHFRHGICPINFKPVSV